MRPTYQGIETGVSVVTLKNLQKLKGRNMRPAYQGIETPMQQDVKGGW